MTKPQLERMKFWIVKPHGGHNYLKNPAFAKPTGVTYWAGTQATVAVSGDEQRRGAYSMKVTPVSGQSSYVAYAGLAVTEGLTYTFSCDIKGVAGQAMRIYINAYAAEIFKATGYWQRVQVTAKMGSGVTEAYVVVQRDSVASNEPFYVDGVQFEQTMEMTTFIEGNQLGCGWVGLPLHSTSWRDPLSGNGGLLLDLSDYARILSVHGLGMGDWNQVMTKMTSGGDMYQTHIRKSRNFSMVLAYTGDNQGDMQANRKVIIDALRPDYLFGSEDERRIIRYQGFDSNGDEATNPVDIVCVFQPSHTDTPSLPVFQKDVLNFTIPSGLLNGAYNEGKELDLYADFPAEHIVKRDPQGNWCKWNGTCYDNSLKGQGTVQGLNGTVQCIAEGPDGKIYVGGGFKNAGDLANADYLARWNPVTEAWEAVVTGINFSVLDMKFDANGDLYIVGPFTNLGSTDGNYIVKIIDPSGTPTISALGTGLNGVGFKVAIDANNNVYAGGNFTLAGGVANTAKIAKWNGTAWSALSTGLNGDVRALAFAPDDTLWIGGAFTDADGTNGDYMCYWDGTSFNRVGAIELNNVVWALSFSESGLLFAGGSFTNAGGIANADYIACWNGTAWSALGTGISSAGMNTSVYSLLSVNGKLYVSGYFYSAGGLTLTDRTAVWANGSWMPLDINLPGTTTCRGLFVSLDGSLYIGGDYSTAVAGENAETGIVALNLNVTSASANTYPFIQVHGPGTLKAITNYSTGKTIAFDGLTLNAGEWINLSFDPLNLKFRGGWAGRGNLMRYVIPSSDYGDFYLRPGANKLSVFMTDSTSDSGAWIAWTPLFWGIDGALL